MIPLAYLGRGGYAWELGKDLKDLFSVFLVTPQFILEASAVRAQDSCYGSSHTTKTDWCLTHLSLYVLCDYLPTSMSSWVVPCQPGPGPLCQVQTLTLSGGEYNLPHALPTPPRAGTTSRLVKRGLQSSRMWPRVRATH